MKEFLLIYLLGLSVFGIYSFKEPKNTYAMKKMKVELYEDSGKFANNEKTNSGPLN